MVRLLEERAQNAAAPGAVGDAGTPLTQERSVSLELLDLLGLQIRRLCATGRPKRGSILPGSAPTPAVPPPPTEPVSLFMAFCPEQPNGPRPNTSLPIPTPCQRVGHRY